MMPKIFSDHKLPYPLPTPSIINIRLTVLEIMFTQGSGTPNAGQKSEYYTCKSHPETSFQARQKEHGCMFMEIIFE